MSQPDRTLVTGFGPFLNVTDNPSARLAEGCGRRFKVLEVSFEAADEFLASLDPIGFDRLLLMGVADDRKHVCPEMFARNQIGHTRDVRGVDRFGEIEEGAPLLLESTLWERTHLEELFPSPELLISLDAGSYLCNYTYYRALRRFPEKKVGFLHVPNPEAIVLEEQARVLQVLLEHAESV